MQYQESPFPHYVLRCLYSQFLFQVYCVKQLTFVTLPGTRLYTAHSRLNDVFVKETVYHSSCLILSTCPIACV